MSRSIVTALALGLLLGAACKKKENDTSAAKTQEPAGAKTPDKPTAPANTPTTDTAGAGVEAGGIQRDEAEGAAAVFASMNGTVEVRRVGETTWTAATKETKLYPGDQVRTGEMSTATITLADESIVEVAEVTTIGIASRNGTADPASAAAVLGGLARFTVTARAPGEGAFRVYTPSGVVLTRGTVYGVGVAASGEARVGVEAGMVDVIGLAKLDATPVVVEKTSQVVIAADGNVGTAAAWPADDWGTWRDEADAKIQLGAAVEAHGSAMADLNKQLVDGYAELQTNADQSVTFEATAATAAEKNDPAAYTAALPEGSATIDASFALGSRLEALTWAYAGHGALATDLYVRHPTEVQGQWQVIAPRVDAAILWPKRFEVTAGAYFEPLRAQYYVHHPRGRAHAALVGIAVPQFYASVEPQPIEPAQVRAKVKGGVWIAPDLTYKASARPVWAAAPAASWHAKVKVQPAPARAKVAWYVRPATPKANVFVGAKATGTWNSKLAVNPPQPWGTVRAAWKIPVGMKVKIGAPDMNAAANARAKIKLGADGRIVRDHRAAVAVPTAPAVDIKGKAGAKVGGAVDVKPPAVDVKGKVGVGVGAVHDHRAGAAATVRDHRAGAAGAGAQVGGAVKAGATIKVDVPKPPPPPAVKVEGKVKAGIKIGN